MLTKPDTIPAGASTTKQLWIDVIEGRRFPLKLGYFCTKQPGEDERLATERGDGQTPSEQWLPFDEADFEGCKYEGKMELCTTYLLVLDSQ